MNTALKCACGKLATGTIEADLLRSVVHITIGVCDAHAPANEAAAMAAITALLTGIAKAGAEVSESRGKEGKDAT